MKAKTTCKWLKWISACVFLLSCGLVNAAHDEGVVLKKDYEANTDGTGELTLQAYVTGETVTIEREVNMPLDIVFVLDYTRSMGDTLGSGKKIDALKTVMVDTLKSVYEKRDTGLSGTHRVAFVGYCGFQTARVVGDQTIRSDHWINGTSDYLNNLGSAFYGSALKPIVTDEEKEADEDVETWWASSNVKSIWDEAIGVYTDEVHENTEVYGGTRPSYGLMSANNIFANNSNLDSKSGKARQRVVILLTDGAPSSAWKSGAKVEADDTIQQAYLLKSQYGADVYTIGLLEGAANTEKAPEATKTVTHIELVPQGQSGKYKEVEVSEEVPCTWLELEFNVDVYATGSTTIAKCNAITNAFLHVVSSDFPRAQKLEMNYLVPGMTFSTVAEADTFFTTGYYDQKHYFPADNTSALSNIFTKIFEKISTDKSSYELDSNTVLKDIVSDDFSLPEEFTNASVTVKVAKFAGYDSSDKPTWDDPVTVTSGIDVTVDTETKTIDVTGFDYSANWVGIKESAPHGSKLIIVFTIIDNGTGLGTDLPTNAAGSGVYKNLNTGVKEFTTPVVDVPYCIAKHYLRGIDGTEELIVTENLRNAPGVSGDKLDVPVKEYQDYVYSFAKVNGVEGSKNVTLSADSPVTVALIYDALVYVHHLPTDQEVEEDAQPEKVIAIKALDEGGTFNITAAVDGVYNGITEGYLYGGLLSSDKDDADILTNEGENGVCGVRLEPTVGKNYYVREIPDVYIQPKVLGKKIKNKWYVSLVTVIDDPDMYKGAGFNTEFDDEESEIGGTDFDSKYVYDSISFKYRNENDVVTEVSMSPNDILSKKANHGVSDKKTTDTDLDGKLICYDLTADETDEYGSSTPLKYTPFFVTMDNVRVTSIITREVSTSSTAAPAWSDDDSAGSQTSENVENTSTKRTRALSLAPLKSYTMGPEDDCVTLTVNVNGDASEYYLEAGTDATEYVDIPYVEDTVFAGWYAEQACTTPVDISRIDEDTEIYAKMLAGEYLAVKGFNIKENDSDALVCVMAVDSAYASSFGFTYTLGSQKGSKVVDSLVSSYNGKSAQELFDGVSADAKLCVMTLDLAEVASGSKIKVTPYWITKGGIKVIGTSLNLTYISENIGQ